MSRKLNFYVFLICLPAVVLTGFGLFSLNRLADDARMRDAEVRSARIERMAESVQNLVNERGKTGDVLRTELRNWKDDHCVRKPVGAFIWTPDDRFVWSEGMNPFKDHPLAKKEHSRGHWNDWTAVGKKRARRGVMPLGVSQVLWGRVDNTAYGLVFDGPLLAPERKHLFVWLFGGILVTLLLCILAMGTWLILRSAKKDEHDSRVMVRAMLKERRESKMKTDFLSNCSHELKIPLTGIGIWANMLREGRLRTPDEIARAYTVIVTENARMMRLVENLLDLSRLERGKRSYALITVDIVPLVTGVVDLVRGDFTAHGVTVHAKSACVAYADADAFKQILVNLLGNAAKYAAGGGSVDVVVSQNETCCRVDVADRGPGLSPADRERVFERFYRADDSLSSKTGGLGVGLAISRSLAQGMGGSLVVTARDGGGCVFTLELPNGRV